MAKIKPFFEPISSQADFPAMEKELLSSWYKKGVVKKYLTKNKNSKKYFSFQDGPITANNPMGVHHAWGRTYKDLWPRFYSMRGYKQRHQNGFDCQGLWVEVEVEKELGFKSKKDIEKFGVAKFVKLCKDRVKKYSKIQTEQSKRLGYFADWDRSYFTMSDENNYMIWHFLKVCHENGWIYKGNDSVPWCPRCETAISQHEMLTEDYKELTHESIYLSFPLSGSENQYLLVWTTTPWTIPANIAVAVDSNLEYSLVEFEGKQYWIASDAVVRVFGTDKYKIVKKTKGAKLVGLRYKGAFDKLPAVAKVATNDKFHTVVATDSLIMPITTTEGTGLVHTAVSAGSEDFKLGKKHDLPMIPVIADDASYLDGFGEFSGKNAKKDPKVILDYLNALKEKGESYFYKIENYKHRYPACWRCKAELVWKVADEWYIAMDKGTPTLRERMKEVTKKINWMPSFGLDREIDWLNNMHDWLISKKNRYWGLALPIWECKSCGSFEVIGGKEELKEKAVEGFNKLEGKSPHKPQVDEVKIKCSKCGQVVSRIEPVGNPWLDAGIVPFSTISENNDEKPLYKTDKKEWLKWFPVDFITESFPGQFKNWFYSLIAMGTVLENINPFKNVLGFGTLLGEDGRPMHKSWGNSIEFNEGADKIGVDVARWMFSRANPAENMLFGYKIADEVRRKFHLKLWNVYNFFVTYANLDGWKPSKGKTKSHGLSVLDKWILVRLDETTRLVTEKLENFDAFSASGEIEKFVDDLSLWFVRRSRDRVGPASENEKDKKSFYETTYQVLTTLSQLLAPFTPFIADFIYMNLTKEESVHLSSWPIYSSKANVKNDQLTEEMQTIRSLVEKAHSIRKEKNLPVKQPLASYTTKVKQISKNVEYLIKDEINVKKVIWGGKADKFDTKITKELEEELMARELIRKIQEKRKEMKLNLTQKVNVKAEWLPVNSNIKNWVSKKAQVAKLDLGPFNVAKTK